MGKSILYRWFGLRKVPTETRTRLTNEGIIFDEEGTSCALCYRNFRGPRNSSGRGWESGAVGTLVITQRTFYVQFPYMIVCDQPIETAVQGIGHSSCVLAGSPSMGVMVSPYWAPATGLPQVRGAGGRELVPMSPSSNWMARREGFASGLRPRCASDAKRRREPPFPSLRSYSPLANRSRLPLRFEERFKVRKAPKNQ